MSANDQFLLQRIESAEQEVRDLRKDYADLNEKFSALSIEHAAAMERQKAVIDRLDRLDGGLGKLFWLVAGSAVSFVMVWVFQGGMANIFKGE